MRFIHNTKNFISNVFLFRFSIKYRLLFYFLVVVFLPTSIISVTIFYKSSDIITERVHNSTKNNLNMIETSFNQKLEGINDVMQLIYMSPELQSIISSPYFTSQSQNILSPLYAGKNNFMINEMISLDRILSGYSDMRAGNATFSPKFYIYNRAEYLLTNTSDKVTDLITIQNEDWYSKIPYKCQYSVVGLNTIKAHSGYITTLRVVKRLYGLKNVYIPYAGLLTVDVGIDGFNHILKNYMPSAGSTIYIIDRDNRIISSSDTLQVGSFLSKDICIFDSIDKLNTNYNSTTKAINDTDTIVSYKKMVKQDYMIVSTSPVSEMYGELVSLNMVMALVMVICLVLSFVVAMFLSENVSYPIRKLVKSMSAVKDGNFDVAINYKRNDEFSFLISTYNKMVGQIKELINKLYVSELNKKEAELKSLQAQINPHFLYNTLDSVNWLALKHDVPDISTMVTSLSDFFRYSLSKGRDIIPLRDEKKQVESYLEIQRIRFKDKIDYYIDFPKDILECLTVKLILQPIVENAILHGIEQRRGKGSISITGSLIDDHIEIKISDDGVGADLEELNSMLYKGEPTKAYGIRNVNERIKHTFGENFGLEFCSNEPSGVTAIIRLPATRSMEGLNVKNDNSR